MLVDEPRQLTLFIRAIHDGTGTGSGDDYTTTYSFDLVGNRVEMITDSSDAAKDRTVTYTYDNNDRLLTETSDAVTGDDTFTEYAWGTLGSATQQTEKVIYEGLDDTGDVIESVSYVYNLQGRLAQATIIKDSDTTVLDYTYDDSGIRVSQTQTINAGTPVVTEYLVDHQNHTGYQQVLEEFVDAVLARSYTIGLDVIAQTNAGMTPATYAFLYDAHGSTRALLDALAEIVQTYAYDAYGNALGFDPAAALTTLLYSGEQFDQKLAMQYLRARYYDAGTGRFNRVDQWEGSRWHPPTLNKYLYANGNPVYNIDPTGLMSINELMVNVGIGLVVLQLVTPIWSGLEFALSSRATPGNIPRLHLEYARMAREVYSLIPRPVESWHPLLFGDLEEIGLNQMDFIGSNGFFATLYRNINTLEYALVFRGSELNNLPNFVQDYSNNIGQAVSGPIFSSQYRHAISLASKVQNAIDGAPLMHIGHSLGGGLASAAAITTGDPAVTFNAAGINPLTHLYSAGLRIWRALFYDITAYQLQGEILTTVQSATLMSDARGSKRILSPALQDRNATMSELHGMDYVLRSMGYHGK